MRDARTIVIPSIVLNYEDNLLESVGIGGELYYRKQRDWYAIARSYEQTIERMGAENAKLRELVRIMYYCNLPQKDCDQCAINDADMEVRISDIEFCDSLNDRMRHLRIEVDR